MSSTVDEHLRRLGSGRRSDLPETTAGTVRLDARDGAQTEHWYLTIADQHIQVSRSVDDADLVVRAERQVFDRIAGGQLHLAAALLRNELTVRGDMRLLMMLRRVFPGPPDARHPRQAAAARGGRP
ncbi:SCP2 sterol-binding domain-containing protein [Micromonospora endolithica]|uniref:Sterol-binding protein n=1 Tax=Micromonospora endolithica TaxID=230091 RepID=A0A3A9ZAV7_9ACTN|nr:SCP2 sterol-binding domain-containing protein [Micromonospora endolithica]RKN45418.1 sterol-binding protein [Micromonospora endolithica]TWJ22864.1 SCP-2 sterol transfer family protein [Micromonospora endolithica]